MRQLRELLDVIATIAIIAMAGIVGWSTFHTTTTVASQPRSPTRDIPLPEAPIPLAGAAIEGSDTAPLAVIEFSDFQCPFCANFARDTLPQLREKYVRTGKVRLAFQHLPLKAHRFAETAARAANCAGRQTKFWQMHGVGIEAAEGYINGISEGQVLAFEPILTVDGVGIYLEDMILVTSNGAEVLTKGLPYTSSEIEAAMRTGRVGNR